MFFSDLHLSFGNIFLFASFSVADVFETQDESLSRPHANDCIDGNGDVLTPTRPRTTEDLFAAIHR